MNNDVLVITAGGATSMGIRADSCLYSWGQNDYGQVGNGSTTSQYTPALVGPGCHWDPGPRLFMLILRRP